MFVTLRKCTYKKTSFLDFIHTLWQLADRRECSEYRQMKKKKLKDCLYLTIKKMKCPLPLTEITQTIRLNIVKKEC